MEEMTHLPLDVALRLVASLQASSDAQLPSRDMTLAVPAEDTRPSWCDWSGGCEGSAGDCGGAGGAMRIFLRLVACTDIVTLPAAQQTLACFRI